jgi:hypothetical protein
VYICQTLNLSLVSLIKVGCFVTTAAVIITHDDDSSHLPRKLLLFSFSVRALVSENHALLITKTATRGVILIHARNVGFIHVEM